MQVTELKSTVTELKNILERLSIRISEEEWISDLEDRAVELSQTKLQQQQN